MIDTGATSSLITMEKIIELNLLDRVYHQPGEIILGDSITKIHQKRSIDLTFRIKYLTCTIQAKIVDKLTYGIILGMDFVTQYQVDIHTRNQFILLHHQGQKLRVDFEKPQSVRTKQEYTILPRCKRVIDAQVCGITEGVRVGGESEGEFPIEFQASYDDRFDYCLDSHHQASSESIHLH